jgi:hypothetical protein
MKGLTGHGEVVIYSSTNLVDWSAVQTNVPVVGELWFFNAAATNSLVQFYWVEER